MGQKKKSPARNRRISTGWTQKQGRQGGIALRTLVLIAVVGALAAAGGYLLQRSGMLSLKQAASTGDGFLQINELMSENTSTLITESGEVPDWIEVINAGDAAVDTNHYSLILMSGINKAFHFPSTTLQPGECMLVYADGSGQGMGAPFKLPASGGDTLILLNPQGKAGDMVELPELAADSSYRRNADGEWEISRNPTPGVANDSAAAQGAGANSVQGDVEFLEVMSANSLYYPDESGAYYDYVELHNRSTEAVDLTGWYLSDASDRRKRWCFPQVTLPAGGYLVVHCSGLNRTGDASHLHSDFKLSADGENLYLSNPQGQTVSSIEVPALEENQAWSLTAAGWSSELGPTPGLPNDAQSAADFNAQRFSAAQSGLCLSEIMASPADEPCDWVEIYNASAQTVDLSGYGLSDNAGRPRKWQFPSGTTLQPGSYLLVMCSSGSVPQNYINTGFNLSSQGGYTLSLSDAQGQVLDAVYLPRQYGGISFGRMPGESGYFYFETATPGTANGGSHYQTRAEAASCSVAGGLFATGDNFSVSLSAPEGSRIYYTLDCSDPDEGATLYTGPITVSGTTILRSRVYRDGCMPSLIDTQSYLFDVQNDSGVFVVSLVSDMDNLTGASNGILSNNLEDWEREAHVELFTAEGECLISQGCGISLHGVAGRELPVKSFNVIARSEYGENRFNYPIFSQRDYDSYQSFMLRPSGEDYNLSFMRDSVLSSLMQGSSLMYQECEIAITYLDGQYYSLHYIRERINKHSICQFEGWEGMEDEIDLVKGNSSVVQGSNSSFAELLNWIEDNDTTTDAAYEYIDSRIDIQNFIEYMTIEIFSGNADTLNVRRYRNSLTDGKWRWALYDLDWAFFEDRDSIREWLTPGGAGSADATDNTLFIGCMKNPRFLDAFLTYFGEKLATDFSTENVLAKFEARYARIEGVLPQYLERWNLNLDNGLRKLAEYAEERPGKIIGYFQDVFHFSDAELQKYFGAALEKIQQRAEGEAN